MLPSTGNFKSFNCPFYDSGLCERPYCHFRHLKKESQSSANEGMESGEILQKLVSAAVQRVLKQTESPGPKENSNDHSNSGPGQKATYNPTPISELKKINSAESENNEDIGEQRRKHIPVPYTPRKPICLPIKRAVEIKDAKPFIYIPPTATYTPGGTDKIIPDPYTPKGGVESGVKYLPGTEKAVQAYSPMETTNTNKLNYIPSDKTSSKNKKILEYKPAKVTSKNEQLATYNPTPRELVPCFSSDEEEPESKKRKISTDFNGLDELDAEFDILDEILHEEQSHENNNKDTICESIKAPQENKPTNGKVKSDKECIKKNETKEGKNKKHETSDIRKTEKVDIKKSEKADAKNFEKNDVKKTDHKDKKRDKKEHKSSHSSKGKEIQEKSKSAVMKSSHKSSSKDKDREKHKDREKVVKTSDNKSKSASSKSSHRSSKESERSSLKSSDHKSKHSSSSKSKSEKNKSKSHSSHPKSSRDESKDKKKDNRSNKDKSNKDEIFNDDGIETNDECVNDISEESDEDAINEECKKIFEEYVPTEIKSLEERYNQFENIQEEEDEYVPTSKKRISKVAEKNIKIAPRAPVKPDYKVNAAQAMAERLVKVREFHAMKTAANPTPISKPDPPTNIFSMPTPSGKIRIAHVPYASTLMNAKKTISTSSDDKKTEPSTSSTIVQTVKKGSQRVAHIPSDKFIDRPGVLEPLGSKIPANIRSTYLNMMIDVCVKIYLTPSDAYSRAQHEELATSKKCSTVQIYKNSAVLAVSRLRKEFQECNGIKKCGSECSTLQNIAVQKGGAGWSIIRRTSSDNSQEFHGAKLYKNLQKWILTEEQLKDNGFPRPHPSGQKGKAIIHGQNKRPPPKGYIRTCCRCKKEYTVNKKGFASVTEECVYHPNNKYRIRGEAKYQCCGQDSSSDGCCVAPSHVYEYVDFENLSGYVTTMPPSKETDDYGAYSLDCEMCYTTHGLDLTRVTVINSDCRVVYETLIRPLHPIVDYNTRFSGITEEQMANVRTTLLDVQATLLTMFNNKTILIGHSLESDFKALKLIHDTVIDTSVLFPHKMGPPYKRALRNLSSEYLKKIIQNSVDGHNSAEDATVCMELIHFKLKEELKIR